MVTPVGSETYTPNRNRDEFDATCGGMGLTGVITQATLRLLPIETSQMIVDTERVGDLDACMSLLADERREIPLLGRMDRWSCNWQAAWPCSSHQRRPRETG